MGVREYGDSSMIKKKSLICVLALIIVISSALFSACGKSNDDEVSVSYSELKADDMEIIDSINQNLDCEFKLLEEMNVDEKSAEGPYTEFSSGLGEVKSYGVFVSEKDAPIRTGIYIIKDSDYSIYGIKYGDTYKTAKELVEKSGFTLLKEEPFNSNTTSLTYSKGIAKIVMEIDYTNKNSFEDGSVSRIGVSLSIGEADYNPSLRATARGLWSSGRPASGASC